MFCFIFCFSLLFPYSGDDLTWSINELSIKTIINFSTDLSLNGRYFGNIFAIFLTKNIFIRGLIISTVLSSIICIIKKYEKTNYIYILILLMMMPLEIFKQSIVWASGFANYAISTLLLLLILVLSQKIFSNNKIKITHVILPIIILFGTTIIENMSLFLIIYFIVLNILYYIKNKTINWSLIICLIFTLLGNYIMFSHPVYLNVFKGNDTYRNIAGSSNIIKRIFGNYGLVIKEYIINYSSIVWLMIVLIVNKKFKNTKIENSKKKKFLTYALYYEFIYIIFSIIITILKMLSITNNYILYIDIVLSIIFVVLLLLIIINIYSKEYDIYAIILTIVGLLMPLLVVNPVGARNMFMIYVLLIILLFKLVNKSNIDLNNNRTRIISFIIIIVFIGFYTGIYYKINKLFTERNNYIIESFKKGDKEILVPYLDCEKFVWQPDFDNYRKYALKVKMGISEDVDFKFINYEEWKEKANR